jgi:hypothetical protein
VRVSREEEEAEKSALLGVFSLFWIFFLAGTQLSLDRKKKNKRREKKFDLRVTKRI